MNANSLRFGTCDQAAIDATAVTEFNQIKRFTGSHFAPKELRCALETSIVSPRRKEYAMKLQLIAASVLVYVVLAAAWICNTIGQIPLF